MTKKKTVVLWDWDNTLIDTKNAVTRAVNDVVEKYHLPKVDETQIRGIMGTYRGSYWQSFGNQMEEALHLYLERYAVYSNDVYPFNVAECVLNFLMEKNVSQFVASNKRHDLLQAEVDRIGWNHFFNRVQGTGVDHDSKPNKSFADSILKGISYDSLIMIGDGESDMHFARNIGATAVLVHNTEYKNQWPCDIVCKDLTEVLNALKQYF